MRKMKNLALAVSLAASSYTCSVYAQTEVKMINPLPRSTVLYPLVVSEALGYFEEKGVTVKLLPSDTSIPYVAFVQNGHADLAMLDQNETIKLLRLLPAPTLIRFMRSCKMPLKALRC